MDFQKFEVLRGQVEQSDRLGTRPLKSTGVDHTHGSGTIVGTLALAEGAIDAETLWRAAQVDEDWQIEHWGEDELATRAREAKHASFDAAARFLAALGRG